MKKIFQESLKLRLTKLAAPIFIETLLIMMLGAVDVIMLSRHSDTSVAAVGVVNQIIMLTFLVFEVINLGTSVLCSQYIGARMEKKVVQVVGVSLMVNVVVGLTVSLFLFALNRTILGWMGLGPELMDAGSGYMRIVGAFAFFQAVSMTLSASLRSANKAVYPMLVTVVVNILNITGNYTLIFGKFGFPALGVEGAAISTAFSRGIAMVILFIILFRKHIRRFPLSYFRPFPFEELRNLMKVGLPSAGEQLSYSSSQVVIAFLINKVGVEALAARTYCVNIIMFSYLFCISIAQGGAICIGYLIGEGRLQAAFILGKYVMKKIHPDHADPIRYTGRIGSYDPGMAHHQSGDHSSGSHGTDHRCDIRDRSSDQYLCYQRATCGRRCELSVLCRTDRHVECSSRRKLPVGYTSGLGIAGYVDGICTG